MPALLCVHPHPDDESIACGGVIAQAVDAGYRVKVVTCTRGEEGENLAGIDLGDEDLVTHRVRELADALDELGVSDHEFLGYRDSGMVDTPGNAHPDSFHAADLYEASARLARTIRRFRPDVVVSDDANGTYGHPDHVKGHRVTERALAMAEDPWWHTPDDGEPHAVAKRYVFAFTRSAMLSTHRRLLAEGLASPFGEGDIDESDLVFGIPDEDVTTIVDISPVLDRKRAAMRAHRSQIGEDSFFLNVPEDLVVELFGTEAFVLLAGEVGATPEEDLFAGLAGGTS
ncbi:MAG: N-acetyl-1-D-myo-inositol-2-amino-2-deoxy-alpha-D-glucopyranoside deacetylase [Actinobacteria bacterium]|nr:N-acetyl-1-D-myo-inositol-2-amino-2-deoxy-alpha-D-glucopyranoside deacetylase [Actinomycetota bacterium]